jgi:hypothetical protein
VSLINTAIDPLLVRRYRLAYAAPKTADTGAAIASEGERRRNGYYYYRDGCYLPCPDGAYVAVDPRYCC